MIMKPASINLPYLYHNGINIESQQGLTIKVEEGDENEGDLFLRQQHLTTHFSGPEHFCMDSGKIF